MVPAGMVGPGVEEARGGIEAWLRGGLLLEKYRYAPGPAEELPKHSHDEYQICLSLDFPGVYRYRRKNHPVPVGSLSVIHPGEVHSARDRTSLSRARRGRRRGRRGLRGG